jgi:hypothetical protein
MYEVTTDESTRTIRPIEPAGDEFYGLAMGTNGTGATCRRQLIEGKHPGYHWQRHDATRAAGINYVPPTRRSDADWVNPWDGAL